MTRSLLDEILAALAAWARRPLPLTPPHGWLLPAPVPVPARRGRRGTPA